MRRQHSSPEQYMSKGENGIRKVNTLFVTFYNPLHASTSRKISKSYSTIKFKRSIRTTDAKTQQLQKVQRMRNRFLTFDHDNIAPTEDFFRKIPFLCIFKLSWAYFSISLSEGSFFSWLRWERVICERQIITSISWNKSNENR